MRTLATQERERVSKVPLRYKRSWTVRRVIELAEHQIDQYDRHCVIVDDAGNRVIYTGRPLYGINRWVAAYDNWLCVGAVVGACLSVPPLLAVMPKRPTIEDCMPIRAYAVPMAWTTRLANNQSSAATATASADSMALTPW